MIYTSITPQQSQQPFNCSPHNVMEKVPGTQCDSEVYTGQSCMQQLVTTQSCTLQSEEPVMVAIGQQQQIKRMMLFNFTLDALKRELPNSRLIILTGTN